MNFKILFRLAETEYIMKLFFSHPIFLKFDNFFGHGSKNWIIFPNDVRRKWVCTIFKQKRQKRTFENYGRMVFWRKKITCENISVMFCINRTQKPLGIFYMIIRVISMLCLWKYIPVERRGSQNCKNGVQMGKCSQT